MFFRLPADPVEHTIHLPGLAGVVKKTVCPSCARKGCSRPIPRYHYAPQGMIVSVTHSGTTSVFHAVKEVMSS